MRRTTTILAAICGLLVAAPLLADGPMTIKGQVVDVVCVMKDKANAGADHAACATSCAKRGQPVGIVTDDGLYEITGDYAANNNAKLIEFIAKTVEVKGEVTEKDGKKTIAATSIALTR